MRPSPLEHKIDRPLFSVVLGSFNRAPLLRETIASVRENAGFAKYEIIVVDGGSTDGSIDWLLEQKDIITIVQHNRGSFNGKPIQRRSWGYFINLGFKVAQGKFILMISDDCLLLPGSIEKGVAAFEQGLSQGRRIGGVAFYFRNWPIEDEYYVQKTLGGRLMVNHGLFLREALEYIGWIDEDAYLFYKADGDLCLRLWEGGYEIIDSPESYLEHYLDEVEAVRCSNNATLEKDKATYTERWRRLTLIPVGAREMGKLKRSFDDPAKTFERFLPYKNLT